MDQQLITRIVEAALLAAGQPLTLVQLHGLVHGDHLPLGEAAPAGGVEQALEALREQSAGRGVELVEVASGYRFQVQADVHPWIARLWSERQTKYTRATLETLALIAYRQPITRGEIEQIRGVAVNSNIIKALEEREWIRVVGHRDVPGKPELLGTTRGFLDYFGLKRLDQLPPLSELKDFGELEPQLPFDGKPAPIGTAAIDHISDMNDALAAAGPDLPWQHADDVAADAAAEHDSVREERADSDPTIADADHAAGDAAQDQERHSHERHSHEQPALADDGDSSGVRND